MSAINATAQKISGSKTLMLNENPVVKTMNVTLPKKSKFRFVPLKKYQTLGELPSYR
ncbi:hypothetical protein OAU25_00160 [Crocinitomicaceae bacterium]|nr:hypothetical protein [Crocinitomicaceae bacterium]